MKNQISDAITGEIRNLVDRAIQELELEGFRISLTGDGQQVSFLRAFHTATVSFEMIRQNRWADIRHVFRAALGSSPQLTNQWAEDNEWSRDWK